MLTRCCFLGCKGCCCLENPKCKASVQREAARWGSMRQSSARRSDLSTLRGSRPSSRDHIKTIQTTTQPFSCVTNLPSPLYIREHILYIHSIYSRWTAYTLHIVRPQQRVKRRPTVENSANYTEKGERNAASSATLRVASTAVASSSNTLVCI